MFKKNLKILLTIYNSAKYLCRCSLYASVTWEKNTLSAHHCFIGKETSQLRLRKVVYVWCTQVASTTLHFMFRSCSFDNTYMWLPILFKIYFTGKTRLVEVYKWNSTRQYFQRLQDIYSAMRDRPQISFRFQKTTLNTYL